MHTAADTDIRDKAPAFKKEKIKLQGEAGRDKTTESHNTLF